MSVLRKVSLPEIENGKDRRKYEYDLVKLLRREVEAKKTELLGASDEQLREAAMFAYDNGYSIDPKDSEVYFTAVMGEDEEGFETVLFVDVSKMYGADLKDAINSGLYTHIETYIDGVRDGDVLPTSKIQTVAYRVDGGQDKSPLMSVEEIILHAIQWSPTLKGKVKSPKEFFDNYEKFQNGDNKLTSPWYIGFKSMAKRRPLRLAIKKDKGSSYSVEYLEGLKERTLDALALPEVSVDLETGEIKQLVVAEPEPLQITGGEDDEIKI